MKTLELAFKNPKVAEVFRAYPPQIRKKLMFLRQLIFVTASETEGVGELEETLKWGEPAYLTQSKSGSTIRIDWKKSNQRQYAMYFHCRTNLIETFKTLLPNDFTYAGNRAIVFNQDDDIPIEALCCCISIALTYHRKKKLRDGG